MSITGIITSARNSYNQTDNIYTLVSTGSGNPNSYSIRCNMLLEPLDSVEVEYSGGETTKIKEYTVKILGKVEKEEYEDAVSRVLVRFNIWPPRSGGFQQELIEMAGRSADGLKGAAAIVLRSIVTGSPISIHFHGDGDGSSGAVALYRAINKVREKLDVSDKNIMWSSTRGIAYNANLTYSDEMFLNNYRSVERPVILVTDFGTTQESNEGIKRIGEVAKQVWIDHHPIEEGFAYSSIDLNVNPWNNGGDSSLTAGFMTSMVAEMLSGIDASDMMSASLVSDHSRFASNDDKDMTELAEVLDAVNIYNDSHGRLTPQYIESIITDREKFLQVLEDYNEQTDEAISIGMNTARKHESTRGFNVYVLDFEKIAKMNMRYIKLGRYTTKLQTVLQERDPTAVTVVYHKRYISARAPRNISKKVGMLSILKRMMSENDEIENAGGHNEAVSLRVDEDSLNSIVSQFVSYLESNIYS